jgi:thiamine biosynthesis lipoprotein
VVCYADNREFADKAAQNAFAQAVAINQVASDYLPDSELSQLTGKTIDTPIPLSPLLYDLLEFSRRMAEVTDGAFDPTFGPLTKLWRQSRANKRLPDANILGAARSVCGWRNFTIDPHTRTITLHRENMAFDLGGVAKGFAADLMLASLNAAGIRQAMITAGGDIRLGDAPPGLTGWRIALQTFDLGQHDDILTLSNAAVSTSGDLHQALEIDGVRYSHILDPVTGLGLTRRIAASVIADEAKFSDALATAACVLSQDAINALRKMPGIREVRLHRLQSSPDGTPSDQSNEP